MNSITTENKPARTNRRRKIHPTFKPGDRVYQKNGSDVLDWMPVYWIYEPGTVTNVYKVDGKEYIRISFPGEDWNGKRVEGIEKVLRPQSLELATDYEQDHPRSNDSTAA